MSRLLDVVIDVAEEDEADSTADHDAVLEVVAIKSFRRVGGLCQRASLPNVHELLSQSVEKVQCVAQDEHNYLVGTSLVFFLTLSSCLFSGELLDQVLVVSHVDFIFISQ